MTDLSQLRKSAREIFDAALCAVDAGEAVRKAITLDGSRLFVGDRKIKIAHRSTYSVAIGKAAAAMASALEQQLGAHFTQGIISAPEISATFLDSSRWQPFAGGHPVPNQASLDAASAAFALLARANHKRAVVIFLVSGGGSAMMEWPASPEITLNDIRATNKLLVNCGADIIDINAVRRSVSAVKDGRLGLRAPDCEQVTLIVSDVPQGQENSVASGPTVTPSSATVNVGEILRKYALTDQLPRSIINAIENPSPDESAFTPPEPLVVLDNDTALQAARIAAEKLGFTAEVAYDIRDQSIESGGDLLIRRLSDSRTRLNRSGQGVCLISGGEFSCPVRGDGVGGRNLETALRLALSASLTNQNFVALCAGTDGIDGNSSAAGALVDNTTLARANAIGLNAEDFLARSDSYSFFHAVGDAIMTGPTGTNVRDIRILLAT